uniref:C2H2-type domain-containing protein n=1 Tax=Parascaris univalens TaxID=6257 RepID=A0A915A9D2_PARUN
RDEGSMNDTVAMSQAMFSFTALLEEQQRRMRSPLDDNPQIPGCIGDRSADSPEVFRDGNDDVEMPSNEHNSQLQHHVSPMELDVESKQTRAETARSGVYFR